MTTCATRPWARSCCGTPGPTPCPTSRPPTRRSSSVRPTGPSCPTALLVRAAEEVCRTPGAVYRPHPSERDRRSRALHARWEAEGIRIDRSGTPLRELAAPVVSVFSTGVVEAAAAGLPAWVHCPDAPPWLEAFWERYDLARWGGPPTASPERPDVEPSRAVAEVVRGMMAA